MYIFWQFLVHIYPSPGYNTENIWVLCYWPVEQLVLHTHTLFDTILQTKDHRTTPHPHHTIPYPTLNHHKQPHSKIKTPWTLLDQRPYNATEDVQYQHETAVSQKLWAYYIAAIVKSVYYIFEFTLYQKDGKIGEQSILIKINAIIEFERGKYY